MTKRQLIDQIVSLNHSAEAEFLAQFADRELDDYLKHLTAARMPRPWRWRGQSSHSAPQPASCNSATATMTCVAEPSGESEMYQIVEPQICDDIQASVQGRLF